jgi:hypothetical protein
MVSWQISTAPVGNNIKCYGVAFGNSTFVTVGTIIMTSNDNGENWILRTSPDPNVTWKAVYFANEIFLAIGSKLINGIRYNYEMESEDGISWTIKPTPAELNCNAISGGNGKWVAVSSANISNRIMYKNGANNFSPANSVNTNFSSWHSVSYGNGLFVAVGNNNSPNKNIIYSEDGIYWSNAVIKTPNVDFALNAITYANGKFVALGSKKCCTSNDGINWNVFNLRTSQMFDWRSLAYSNSKYVAVCNFNGGNKQSMISSNGEAWTVNSTPVTNLTSITSGNNNFVGVSQSGKCMYASYIETTNFGLFTISKKKFSDQAFEMPQPTSNSMGINRYSSSNLDVATITPYTGKINISGVGTTNITVIKEATTTHTSESTSTIFEVEKADTIMGQFANLQKNYDGSSFPLPQINTNSDEPLIYTISNTTIATISGNKVTPYNIGSTTITVSQPENARYTASSTSAVLTISKGNAEIGLFSFQPYEFGQPDIIIKDPGSKSNGAWVYSSSNPQIANIIGNKISIKSAGQTLITAMQAETALFKSETKTAPLTINKAEPLLGQFVIHPKRFGDLPFAIIAPTSTSNIFFNYTSSDESIASIVGGIVTIKKAGNVNITASQQETNNYLAKSITTTLVIGRKDNEIGSLVIGPKTYGDDNFIINQPSTLHNESSFVYSSSDESVATIIGNNITIKEPGQTTITATQYGLLNYNIASTTALLIVNKKDSIIGNFAFDPINYGISSITITPPDTNNTESNLIYSSSDESVASINGNTILIKKVGETTITASLNESQHFLQASISTTLIINKGIAVIQPFLLPPATFGDDDVIISEPVSSNKEVSFTYRSSNELVVSIIGNTLKINSIGNSIITATQVETSNYISQSINTIFEVNPLLPSLNLNYSIVSNYASVNYISPPYLKQNIILPEFIKLENEPGQPTYPLGVINAYAFSNAPNLKSIIIPASVSRIYYYAFKGCTKLNNLVLPPLVSTIEERVFEGCSSLTNITLSNIINIGYRAFAQCTGLISLTLPNSVTIIGEQAFIGCNKIQSFTIPSSVQQIGDNAFNSCDDLTSIYFEHLTKLPIIPSAPPNQINITVYYKESVMGPNNENPNAYLTSRGFTNVTAF